MFVEISGGKSCNQVNSSLVAVIGAIRQAIKYPALFRRLPLAAMKRTELTYALATTPGNVGFALVASGNRFQAALEASLISLIQ